MNVHSLFELLVHGQDGRVADEGEGQDGNCVHSLGGRKTSNIKIKSSTLVSFCRWFHLYELHLGVEDKVFGRAGVAVVHGGGVHGGQGDVKHFARCLVESVEVFRQRTRDLELLDDHLMGHRTMFGLQSDFMRSY